MLAEQVRAVGNDSIHIRIKVLQLIDCPHLDFKSRIVALLYECIRSEFVIDID